MIHGGDIYRNHVFMDFSVNINPLGVPDSIQKALGEAVNICSNYPDPLAEQLRYGLSRRLLVPEKYLLPGNGASELFLAVVHALLPKKCVIAVPSFYGYEYAASASLGEILFYQMKKEHGFCLDEGIFSVLGEDADLLFLANPNNPAGNLIGSAFLEDLLVFCKKRGIYVVLDESFIEFCSEGSSMLPKVKTYKNLLLIRAFTKIFAIPGVRLGYLVCSNETVLAEINRHLPEWNVSVFAQAAGIACNREEAFMKRTAAYVQQEGKALEEAFLQMGFFVFPHAANFIMIETQMPLYAMLKKKGILIRDCSNFRGLSDGYYRIAVKRREENQRLLKMIGELL